MIQNIANPAPVEQPSTAKIVQKHFRVSEPDFPATTYSARLIQNTKELERIVPQWNRLLETAVKVNPFFDPAFLIPSFENFADKHVSVLVVEAPPRVNCTAPPVICALFPVVKKRIYCMPLTGMEIWKHDQCFDCTPLLRHDCAAEAFEFALNFIATELKTPVFGLNTIVAEGEFANLISNMKFNTKRTVFHRDEFTRACFKPLEDAETFINTKVAKNTRKGTHRLRRKLAQQGVVKTEFVERYDAGLVDEFLLLESSGWKGKAGTSLSSAQSTKKFFHDLCKRMFDQGKMVMSRTSLDNRPIAILCDIQMGSYGSHFKIAFDEQLKEYSPGLLVEIDNIHRLHRSSIEFVDSCADPNHSMINRVWSDRVRFQSIVLALGGQCSQFAVSAMPLIQQFKKFFATKR